MSQIDIRGSSQYNKPATLGVILFAWISDLCLVLFLFGITLWILKIIPTFSSRTFLIFIGEMAAFFFLTHRVLGFTPGQKIWRLDGSGRIQKELMTPSIALTGIFLTAVCSTLSFAVFFESIGKNPILLQATAWELESRFPSGPSVEETWVTAPFFYTLGSWPKSFQGHPVFYTLPYEKGPPTRYVGHIIARWKLPGTQVTFEGPKSPVLSTQENISREDLKNCLLMSKWELYSGSSRCIRLRELSLKRHVEEISKFSPTEWTIRWFEVQQKLPTEERTQGFYITATSRLKEHHRVVLVTPSGRHQTIFLDSPIGEEGAKARELFVQALQSLRVADELNPGRALADRVVESVRLQDLGKITEPTALIAKLAEIQAVLLGKISVDPKTFDAFFHLAGTALMLIRESSKNKLFQEDWLASAKPMIYSAFRYAQDIDPANPKTTQIQNLWIESKKY